MYRSHENDLQPNKDVLDYCVSWIVQEMKIQWRHENVSQQGLMCGFCMNQQQQQVGGVGRTQRKVDPRRNKQITTRL